MTRLLFLILIGLTLSFCTNNSNSTKKKPDKYINGVSIIDYSVTRTYPHATDSYTEGFLFHDGKLYESTGSPENYPNTRSVIGIVNLKTGNIVTGFTSENSGLTPWNPFKGIGPKLSVSSLNK